MADVTRLLAVLARTHPQIWELVGGGPAGPGGPSRRGIAAFSMIDELNPQPLPPGHGLLVASASVARAIAYAAIGAEAAGSDGAGRIVEPAIADWCGTPAPPRPIPWPRAWPFPWPPDPGPGPGPDPDPGPLRDADIGASRVTAGLVFASIAAHLEAGPVHELLSSGAEQLFEAAIKGR